MKKVEDALVTRESAERRLRTAMLAVIEDPNEPATRREKLMIALANHLRMPDINAPLPSATAVSRDRLKVLGYQRPPGSKAVEPPGKKQRAVIESKRTAVKDPKWASLVRPIDDHDEANA